MAVIVGGVRKRWKGDPAKDFKRIDYYQSPIVSKSNRTNIQTELQIWWSYRAYFIK